ncbi:MAG: hypothetical protein KC445_10190 [Anaerolineales bacterium]|nr:hypothetical protein [Anaerolineales bacterium]
MSKLKVTVILLAALMATFLLQSNTASAAVVETLGQTTPITSYGSPAFSQTFVPTQTGNITSVTIYPINTASGGVQIYAGAGGGTLLHDQAVSWVGNQPQTVVLTNPVPVTAGQTYTLNPNGVTLGASCCTIDNYPDGEMYINGASYYSQYGNVADLYFQVVIENSIDSDGDGYNDDIDAYPNDPTRAVSCAPGFYGAFECLPAPLGTYVATAGALAASPCPVGTFSDVEAAVSCQLAQPGYFVDLLGAVAQTACSTGTYQPYSGQTSCMVADPGYFVDTVAAIAQTACPAGYTSAAGAVECYRINSAPTAVPGGPYLAAVNSTIVLDGSASTDPEGDALTETWTADFGTTSGSSYTAPADAGIYDICLTVNDGDLDSEAACTLVVVYDPSAGFVTGGGWISSPAGALLANPDATGRASFGFNAKYKKGGRLESETEFQLHAGGDFHFHASSAHWLVLSGAKAQFMGQGRVEESDHTYGFSVTVLDGKLNGGQDMFRIRIWDMSDGNTVVYDSQPGDAFYADPTTLLGGGKIVVHSK